MIAGTFQEKSLERQNKRYVKQTICMDFQVTGEVCDPNGLVEYRIEAIWDRYAHLYKIDSDEKIEHEDTIWTINPLP